MYSCSVGGPFQSRAQRRMLRYTASTRARVGSAADVGMRAASAGARRPASQRQVGRSLPPHPAAPRPLSTRTAASARTSSS
eukprot:scaffold2585_cov368-Prasinococcus_capsulatus_cf.AAC.21